MRIAVVGGGIAGLAAAFEVCDKAEVTVYEPARLGGKLLTSEFAGRLVDEGPDAFLTRTPAAVELATAVGLGTELVAPAAGRTLVYFAGRLHPLPSGLVLGAPTDIRALATSKLLGPLGAARAAWDLVAPATPVGDDETVRDLIAARFGPRVADRLVEPLLGSIHAAPTAQLSARATAPSLLATARSSRSLLAGLRKQAPAATNSNTPVFLAPRSGMSSLIERTVEKLRSGGVRFVSQSVRSVSPPSSRVGPIDVDGEPYDGAVLAVGAPQAARILGRLAPSGLSSVEFTDVAVATVCVSRSNLGLPDDVNGILVSPDSGMLMTACSFGSNKWPRWSSGPDQMVLRISAGRSGDTRAVNLSDEELAETLIADLSAALRRPLTATQWRVSRWPGAFPFYRVGHLRWVDMVQSNLAGILPQVALAGSSYNGAGIPACIASGRSAARQVSAVLSTTSAAP
ncbi:MAG: protoporphyrinogen oxidase [Acidimicrobiales bacterium]